MGKRPEFFVEKIKTAKCLQEMTEKVCYNGIVESRVSTTYTAIFHLLQIAISFGVSLFALKGLKKYLRHNGKIIIAKGS